MIATSASPTRWATTHPDDWVQKILSLRHEGEVLLLDYYGDQLTVLMATRHTNALSEITYHLPPQKPVTVPRLSTHGVGELIDAEETLSHQYSDLQWESPEYTGRRVRGKGIFIYPLGPVRADVAESLHYRLSVMGDEIVRLDLTHGLKPRHLLERAQGQTISDAARLLERTTGTSTVAHALAFSLAVEDALGVSVPWPITRIRLLMAELERAYSHLGDLAQLAASTGLPVPQMEYLHLRETVLRTNFILFQHRYLRNRIRPGGIEGPPPPPNARLRALAWVEAAHAESLRIQRDLERTSSFLDRLHGAGTIPPSTLEFIRPVGPVGRAANRATDVRQWRPYLAYETYPVTVATHPHRDAYARFQVRVRELDQSFNIIRTLMEDGLPNEAFASRAPVEFQADSPRTSGLGIVEAPRGQLVYRVLIDPKRLTLDHVQVATPSARNWYVVPPAMANHNILQDFPIVDASFALSVAGWDR